MITKKDTVISKMEQETKEKDMIIYSLSSKLVQESADAVGVYQFVYEDLGFNFLSVTYHKKKDTGFPARLKKDLFWFADPISIKSGTHYCK